MKIMHYNVLSDHLYIWQNSAGNGAKVWVEQLTRGWTSSAQLSQSSEKLILVSFSQNWRADLCAIKIRFSMKLEISDFGFLY